MDSNGGEVNMILSHVKKRPVVRLNVHSYNASFYFCSYSIAWSRDDVICVGHPGNHKASLDKKPMGFFHPVMMFRRLLASAVIKTRKTFRHSQVGYLLTYFMLYNKT